MAKFFLRQVNSTLLITSPYLLTVHLFSFSSLTIKSAKSTLPFLSPPDPFPSGYVRQKLPRVAFHRNFSLLRQIIELSLEPPDHASSLSVWSAECIAYKNLSFHRKGKIRHIQGQVTFSYSLIIHTSHLQWK